MGLFNYAHSYWVSAAVLEKSPREVTHKDAPVDYLYYHAIELYLKSYLRLKGYSLADLKKLGHSIPKLHDRAISEGLPANAEDREVIAMIPANYLPSRYIQTGAFSKARPEALWGVCRLLHEDIEPAVNVASGVSRRRHIPYIEDDDN
ncbi:hypothetical protein C9E82_18895 [Paracoccus siganidrum]|nr:hypothetical protein C9E82_18895 [Paracoccus siganidrum]